MSSKESHGDGRPYSGGRLSPHDSVFRRMLGVPENAASQLRAVLPPGLAARLDLARLARAPGTFVDEALKQRHSDLLFTAPLDGRDAFVYVLIEHQSRSDPLMAFRMLRYVMRIWDKYLEDRPRVRRLPAVIPLVVYNGAGRWSASVQLRDLIDPAPGPDEEEYLPRFSFLLDDLSVVDPDELRGRDLTPAAVVTLLLLKTAPDNPRVHEVLRDWMGELRAILAQPGGTEAFKTLLTYIWCVGETPEEEIARLAASLGPDAEKAYMTTADIIEARGEAIGEAIGEARGRAEGEAAGRAEALIQILAVKFGPLPEGISQTIRGASSAQVEKWTSLAVTVATLDDVFA